MTLIGDPGEKTPWCPQSSTVTSRTVVMTDGFSRARKDYAAASAVQPLYDL